MNYEELFRLDGRVAVVIGAGSGIGHAAAKGLAAHGASVICADVKIESAQMAADEIGANAQAPGAEVAGSEGGRQPLQSVKSERGRVDVAVVTPAINVRKPILKYDDEEFDRVINVSLKGVFRVLREAGRVMAEQGSGSIIAFSSIRSVVVEPGQGI